MATPKPKPAPVKKTVVKKTLPAAKAAQQRGPAVSAKQFQQGKERERAIARKPGMVLTRFGKTGHPVAVPQRKLAAAQAGKIKLHEDRSSSPIAPRGGVKGETSAKVPAGKVLTPLVNKSTGFTTKLKPVKDSKSNPVTSTTKGKVSPAKAALIAAAQKDAARAAKVGGQPLFDVNGNWPSKLRDLSLGSNIVGKKK